MSSYLARTSSAGESATPPPLELANMPIRHAIATRTSATCATVSITQFRPRPAPTLGPLPAQYDSRPPPRKPTTPNATSFRGPTIEPHHPTRQHIDGMSHRIFLIRAPRVRPTPRLSCGARTPPRIRRGPPARRQLQPVVSGLPRTWRQPFDG